MHLVFNGEVYNHRKLRKQLSRKGHHFASDHSDTEVLLLGFWLCYFEVQMRHRLRCWTITGKQDGSTDFR
ncbi:MAG: hypothetical protein AAGA62_16065 [Bacteroidota bacterium]